LSTCSKQMAAGTGAAVTLPRGIVKSTFDH
jgi:hypothetical protein